MDKYDFTLEFPQKMSIYSCKMPDFLLPRTCFLWSNVTAPVLGIDVMQLVTALPVSNRNQPIKQKTTQEV